MVVSQTSMGYTQRVQQYEYGKRHIENFGKLARIRKPPMQIEACVCGMYRYININCEYQISCALELLESLHTSAIQQSITKRPLFPFFALVHYIVAKNSCEVCCVVDVYKKLLPKHKYKRFKGKVYMYKLQSLSDTSKYYTDIVPRQMYAMQGMSL